MLLRKSSGPTGTVIVAVHGYRGTGRASVEIVADRAREVRECLVTRTVRGVPVDV